MEDSDKSLSLLGQHFAWSLLIPCPSLYAMIYKMTYQALPTLPLCPNEVALKLIYSAEGGNPVVHERVVERYVLMGDDFHSLLSTNPT